MARRQQPGDPPSAAPTLAEADRVLDEYVANYLKTADANDILYAFEASRDYDPGPGLEKITAPLLAINSADDIINPPELQILEREITRVPQGTRHRPAAQRPDHRPRHPHAGSRLEALSGGTAPGDRTMTFSLGPYFSLRHPDQINPSARDNARTA